MVFFFFFSEQKRVLQVSGGSLGRDEADRALLEHMEQSVAVTAQERPLPWQIPFLAFCFKTRVEGAIVVEHTALSTCEML